MDANGSKNYRGEKMYTLSKNVRDKKGLPLLKIKFNS